MDITCDTCGFRDRFRNRQYYFINILVGRLPERQRQSGRILGLALAMLTRILLLMSLAWIMKLTAPLFTVFNQEISGRDLILLIGGLFLIIKVLAKLKRR